jgi:hypothetical protein
MVPLWDETHIDERDEEDEKFHIEDLPSRLDWYHGGSLHRSAHDSA